MRTSCFTVRSWEVKMDAVKEAQTAFKPVLHEWAGTIPEQLTDLESVGRFAEDAKTMYGAAYALGLDPGVEVAASLSGSISGGMRTLRSTSTRRRARTRSRSRPSGRSTGNGHGPTGEQVLTFMQEAGGNINQSMLAEHFGVTRQTIAKRLDTLIRDGQVTVHGQGARKTWRAKELLPA
jgi:hypothetical protein